MRYLALLLALTACVNGTPYEPCPTVIVYVSFADTTMVTDSIDYTPECE